MDIDVYEVSVKYGAQYALDSMTFDVRAAEWLSLVGSSGCGKSTLLNSIAGVLAPIKGKVRIGDTYETSARTGLCGYLQQTFPLYPSLRVRDNLDLAVRKQYGSTGISIPELVKVLAIERLLDHLPSELSGGERQRVALARTLLLHRPVLLLDEPFSSIDSLHRKQIRSFLRSLCKETGTTVVLVTHDHEDAISTSDRVGVLSGGTVLQIGPSREVFERPLTLTVGQSFGDVGLAVVPAQCFASKLFPNESDLDQIALGVRETDWDCSDTEEPGYLAVGITGQEYLGSRRRVFVSSGGAKFSVVVASDVVLEGGSVWVMPRAGRYMLYRNGTRL
jgi:ABC-type sugar transport system ATPase subunit